MRTRPNVLKAAALTIVLTLSAGSASAQTAETTDFGPDIEAADNFRVNLRVAEAEAAYQRAFARNHDNPTLLVRYASFKRTLGEYAESIRLLQQAEELVENGGVLIGGPEYLQLTLGITYYRTGMNDDAAAAIFRRFIEEYPGSAAYRLHLAFSEMGLGHLDEALTNLQMAEQLFGDGLNSYRASTLALGYAHLGRRQDVMRLFGRLQQMQTVSQAAWAAAYIALEDYEEALLRLEAAIDRPEPIAGATNVLYFLADNIFDDPILKNPQFQELFDRLRGK